MQMMKPRRRPEDPESSDDEDDGDLAADDDEQQSLLFLFARDYWAGAPENSYEFLSAEVVTDYIEKDLGTDICSNWVSCLLNMGLGSVQAANIWDLIFNLIFTKQLILEGGGGGGAVQKMKFYFINVSMVKLC